METRDNLNAAAPGSRSSSPTKECSVESSERHHHAPYNKLLFARSCDDITKSRKYQKKQKSPSRWKESKESCFSLSDGNLDFCRHQIRRVETSHRKEDNERWCGGRDGNFIYNKKYPAHGNGRMMKNNNPELPKEITLAKAAAKKGEVGDAILSSDGDMRSAKAAKDSTTIEVLDRRGDNISLDVIDDMTMRPNNNVVTGETKKKKDKKLSSSNREEECNLINSLFAEIYIPEQTSFHTITPVEQLEKGILTLSLLQQKEKESSRQQHSITLKKKSTAHQLAQNDNDTSHETNATVVKTENSEDTTLSKSATEFFNKYESICQLRLLTSVYPPPPLPSRNPRAKPPPPPPSHASRSLKTTTNESKNVTSNTTSVPPPPPPPPPPRRRRSQSTSCSYPASVVASSLGSSVSTYHSNSDSSLKYRVPPRTRSQQLRRSQSSNGAPSIHKETKY